MGMSSELGVQALHGVSDRTKCGQGDLTGRYIRRDLGLVSEVEESGNVRDRESGGPQAASRLGRNRRMALGGRYACALGVVDLHLKVRVWQHAKSGGGESEDGVRCSCAEASPVNAGRWQREVGNYISRPRGCRSGALGAVGCRRHLGWWTRTGGISPASLAGCAGRQ